MRHPRNRDRGQQTCRHTKTVTTSNSGLDRKVCEACGHVSFQYAHKTLSIEDVAVMERHNAEQESLNDAGYQEEREAYQRDR